MKKFDILAAALVIVGGLNWGLVAIAEFDLVATLVGLEFGETNFASRVVYGFVGIAVALLGRNHPVGVFLAAILFAILLRGGIFVDAYTLHVSKDIVDMLQGIVIVFVAAEAMFRGPIKKFGLLKRAKV